MNEDQDVQLARPADVGRAPNESNQSSSEAASTRLRLASGSPRRKELVDLLGLPVDVQPTLADETPRPGESGPEMTRRLARTKLSLAPEFDGFALAADTTVVDGAVVLGKPADSEEARRMLRQLRGRSHTVVTSIAVRAPDGTTAVDSCESSVPMRSYSDGEIEAYLATSDPLDKAGAYAIQEGSFDPVDRPTFHDCFANVMGLPLCHLTRTLRKLGREPAADVPAACMAHLRYDCRVYPAILGDSA
jgi:MAF protein